MLFSARSEYACLAMLELASQYGNPKPVPLTDIARVEELRDEGDVGFGRSRAQRGLQEQGPAVFVGAPSSRKEGQAVV